MGESICWNWTNNVISALFRYHPGALSVFEALVAIETAVQLSLATAYEALITLTAKIIYTETVVQLSYISFHPEADVVNYIASTMKFAVQNGRSLNEEKRPWQSIYVATLILCINYIELQHTQLVKLKTILRKKSTEISNFRLLSFK